MTHTVGMVVTATMVILIGIKIKPQKKKAVGLPWLLFLCIKASNTHLIAIHAVST